MRLPLLALMFGALSAAALAEPAPTVPAADDEPLPESALRRFGTTKFRPGTQQNLIAYSPDGRYLASSGYDGKLHVWQALTGREVRSFVVPHNQVHGLRFSPDGRLLAAGSSDGMIRVWSVGDWTEHTPPPPPNRTWDQPFFDWLPDSKTIVRIGRDGKLRLQDAFSARELQSWTVGQVNVSAIACRPDGKLVVTQGHDHLLRAWNLANGQEDKSFEIPQNSARVYRSYPRLFFSADGKTLIAPENERTVLAWDTETGKIARRLEVPGYLQAVALSPSGRTLATVAGDSRIRLWGIRSGRELRTFDIPRETATAITFSTDGKHLVSAGNAVIRFWDIEQDRELYADLGHRGAVNGLAFLNGSQQLVSSGYDGTLRLWDCARGDEVERLSAFQYYYGSSLAVVDGNSVLFPASGMTLQRWSPTEGRMHYVGLSSAIGTYPTLAPDGRTAVVVAQTSYVLYDVATGKQLRSIEAPDRYTNAHALSAGGRYFAATHGSRDLFSASQVSIYEIATGRRARALIPPHAQPLPVNRLVFSADNRFLAAVYSNNNQQEIRIWELNTGLTRAVIRQPVQRTGTTVYRNYQSAVFTPDSRCVIVGGASGEVIVCELDTGEALTVDAHRGAVQSVCCSADGARCATGSADTSILLWDLRALRSRAPQRAPLTASPSLDKLEHAWNMIGTTDEKAVSESLWLLTQHPQATVPFLRTKLQPVKGATEGEIAQWVGELGHVRFATRENATRELAASGENARKALVQALAAPIPPIPEARRRIESLLRHLDSGLTHVKLQPIRAVEALERLGTPDARQVLVDLLRQTTDVVVKEEIDQAIQRLQKQPPSNGI